MKWFRSIALILSIVGLLSIVGCKRESNPTIVSSDVSSVTAEIESLISSEEVVISESQEPVSSEPSVVESKPEPASSVADSKPEPEVSSQPEPSSVAEEPSSVVESSEPELPTIPFTIRQEHETGSYIMQEDGTWSCIDLPYGETFRATLIQNVEEFKQAGYSFEKFSKSTDTEFNNYLAQCDDSYFEEYAVIEIQIEHTSGSMWDEMNSITRSGNQLIIHWSLMPFDGPPLKEGEFHIMTQNMENAFHLLEVKRSDVEGITEIIGQRKGGDFQGSR